MINMKKDSINEAYAVHNNKFSFLACRLHPESNSPEGITVRDPFQLDRDRIIHSRAFRRMMHKTQIFNANKGDHYRNRLTHTLEVDQIARSIGKDLGLNDELVEAIALGHDLGHTPFGHIGERTLDKILTEGIDSRDGKICLIKENFKHNFQSLRVVDTLESRCKEYMGINLTFATREGILKHTSCMKNGKYIQYASALNLVNMDLDKPSVTLEGQTVAIADEIAQCTHDLEDGVRSGIIDFEELLQQPLIRDFIDKYNTVTSNKNTDELAYETRSFIIKHLVGFLIADVDETSQKKINEYIKQADKTDGDYQFTEECISFSDEVNDKRKKLQKWVSSKIVRSEEISVSDSKAEYFIRQMFKAFYLHPLELPDYVLTRYRHLTGHTGNFNRMNINDDTINEMKNNSLFIRLIADHIGGMTDQFASRTYKKLYYPDYI